MDDKILPKSIGGSEFSPAQLSSKQDDLCDKLDSLHNKYGLSVKPSSMLRGAVFVAQKELRNNSDWMTQAANSLREILYPFYSKEIKNIPSNKRNILEAYGSVRATDDKLIQEMGRVYGLLNGLAHHGNIKKNNVDLSKFSQEDFEKLFIDFESVMLKALSRQLDIHQQVDKIVASKKIEIDTSDIKDLIDLNFDTRQYFFFKADERWLKWLWENKFLDVIKEKGEDENQFSYTLPELQYLVNILEKDPSGVVDIMLQVPISKENFNPEVVSRFLWICGSLPADQVARIVSKIRDEKWIQLMKRFNNFGFEYEKMLQKLFEAKDWSSLLVLAEVVLTTYSKEDASEEEKKYESDNPFYLKDLRQVKVFEYLVNVDDENLEKFLILVLDVMKKIIPSEKRKNESKVFEIADSVGFYDVDFFTLEFDDERHLSYRDDVKNLATTMKKLVQRMIEKDHSNPENVRKVYEKYVATLPLSQTMWRFRLFVLSLRPDVFREELKKSFFEFFEKEESYELILGAEYDQALKKGFSVLSPDDKRQYIGKVIDFFGKKRDDQTDEKWHKHKGREILACVYSELNEEEKNKAEKILEGKIAEEFNPEPSIVSGMAGFIASKGPIALEDLQKLSVSEVAVKLSNEWTPENLRKMDTERDFMNPLNADGMGNLLKQDIAQRFDLYISNAGLFFDREKLDQHYTYSFFQGVYDVLRQNKFQEGVDLDKILSLVENIIESDKKESFPEDGKRRERFDTWVAGWNSVYYAMSDVIKELLGEGKDKTLIDFSVYRERLLAIIKYLLSHGTPEKESNTKEDGNDPFSVAINSVRGRAFQSFVLFTYRDGDKFPKDAEVKISGDVKEIYEEVLNEEQTYAIMFLYGHYLPSFYYRDKKWINGLIAKIFSDDTEKHDLYLAAWEGYISANIYGDIFSEFKNLYERAIRLDPNSYTDRKYFRGLDEGLATHLALAYAHFSDFNIDSDLFKLFWKVLNTKRHEEFISFVGRHTISRDGALKFIQENKIDIEKIKTLWDWTLNNIGNEEVFVGFGFWMDKERNVFDDSKWLADHFGRTLEKSKGEINWDYGLIKSLPVLAEQAPEETLKILKAYLLDHCLNKPESFRNSIYVDDFVTAFNSLYKNSATKSAIYDLINELILKGGSRFWKLKEVINNDASNDDKV